MQKETPLNLQLVVTIALLWLLTLSGCNRSGQSGMPGGAVFACDDFTVYPDSIVADGLHYTARCADSPGNGADNMARCEGGLPVVNDLFSHACNNLTAGLSDTESDMFSGLSTRSISSFSYLAYVYVDPESTIAMLRKRVRNGRIVQDPAPGGSWPIVTDRIAWATAAWEAYLMTGNRKWLAEAQEVIELTVADDRNVAFNETYGLMTGSLDGPRQPWPKWFGPVDSYTSMCLVNNIFCVAAMDILGRMARINPSPSKTGADRWQHRSDSLAATVRERLWNPTQRAFAAGLYGSPLPVQAPLTDNLGQALAIVKGVATGEMTSAIFTNNGGRPPGMPRFYPLPRPDAPNGSVEGFDPEVQAWWNLALARRRRPAAGSENTLQSQLNAGLAALWHAAARCGADSSRRAAVDGAVVSAVCRVIFGMRPDTTGLWFSPTVPEPYDSVKTLLNFRYRSALLDITLRGHGNIIANFSIDNELKQRPMVPASLTGRHTVEITLANNCPTPDVPRFAPLATLPESPGITWIDNNYGVVKLNRSDAGENIFTTVNGTLAEPVSPTGVIKPHEPDKAEFIGVTALRVDDRLNFAAQSFSTPFHLLAPRSSITDIETVRFARGGTRLITPRDSSRLYLELTRTWNRHFKFVVKVAESGKYLIVFRYANGSSMDDGGTKCAIRTLFVNGRRAGTVVMPQRGAATWSRVFNSNMLEIELNSGRNELSLDYIEPSNINMHGRINSALVRTIRIIKTS